MDKLELNDTEVFMIGDDYFSDIYGGSRNKLKTILVDNKLKKDLLVFNNNKKIALHSKEYW